MQGIFPITHKKQKRVSKLLAVAILKKGETTQNQILLHRRGKNLRWLQGLWELPTVDLSERKKFLAYKQTPSLLIKTLSNFFSKELNRKVHLENYLGSFAHAITHHRFNVHVFEGRVRNLHFTNGEYRWFAANHNKIIPSSSMLKKSLALWKVP